MDTNLLLAFALVLTALLLLRIGFAFWEQFRRRYFSPLQKDKAIFMEVEPVAANITVDSEYLSFIPHQNHRVLLRIVSQKHLVQIACSGGVLLRVEKKEGMTCKILGPNRLLILGKSPNQKASIRIEISTTEEQRLHSALTQAFLIGESDG